MKSLVVSIVIALAALGGIASASVFDMGTGLTSLQVVSVDDPGNTPDTHYYGGPGLGSVAYEFRIGKYEVTAAQYCEFLNAKAATDSYGLYNTLMWSNSYGCKIQRNGSAGTYTYSVASDWANRPVNFVGFWDSCRFANWVHNGQGTSDTETGAYTLSGYIGNDGRTIQRNAAAKWFVLSENEWYKSAYYKGGGTNAGYWYYANQSDTISNALINPDPGHNANYNATGWPAGMTIGSPYYRTNAGEFENSDSAYGTFDQDGNVFEWTEKVSQTYAPYRLNRGGSLNGNVGWDGLFNNAPNDEYYDRGFRIAATVPEPSSFLAFLTGGLGILGLIRRRR